MNDNDNDDFPEDVDCNNNDSQIHPEAIEFPNGIDDDCDGEIDEIAGVERSQNLSANLEERQITLSGDEASHWTGIYIWTEPGAQDGEGNYYLRQYLRGHLENNNMIFEIPLDPAYTYFDFASRNGRWMLLTPEIDSPQLGEGIIFHADEINGSTVYCLEIPRGIIIE